MNIIAKTQLFSKLNEKTLSEKILQSTKGHSNFNIKKIDSKVFSISLKDRDSEVALIILSSIEALSFVRISLVVCDKEEIKKYLMPSVIGSASISFVSSQLKFILPFISILSNKDVDFIETVYKDVFYYLVNLSVVRCPSCGSYHLRYSTSEAYDQDLLDSIGHKMEAIGSILFMMGHGAGGLWNRGKRHKYKCISLNCTKCGHCVDSTKYRID